MSNDHVGMDISAIEKMFRVSKGIDLDKEAEVTKRDLDRARKIVGNFDLKTVAKALAREREEALEKAAKIAEQIEESHAPEVNSFAKAIRSLR